jgi:hypothetical protein
MAKTPNGLPAETSGINAEIDRELARLIKLRFMLVSPSRTTGRLRYRPNVRSRYRPRRYSCVTLSSPKRFRCPSA